MCGAAQVRHYAIDWDSSVSVCPHHEAGWARGIDWNGGQMPHTRHAHAAARHGHGTATCYATIGLVVEAVLAEVDHRLFVFLVRADACLFDLEEVHRVVAGGHRVTNGAFQPAE